MEKICPYCKKIIIYNNFHGFAGHCGTCKDNLHHGNNIKKMLETRYKKNPLIECLFICPKCNILFIQNIKISYLKKGKYRIYCSRNCANSKIQTDIINKKRSLKLKNKKRPERYKRKTIICKMCNNIFNIRISEKKIFCCKECYNKYNEIKREQAYNNLINKQKNKKEKQANNKIQVKKQKNKQSKINKQIIKKKQNINPYNYITIKKGNILEHRLIMENYLGRKLLYNEIVHHVNGDTKDNRIENLQLMTKSEHTLLHKKDIIKYIIIKCKRCKKEYNMREKLYNFIIKRKPNKKFYCSRNCYCNKNSPLV